MLCQRSGGRCTDSGAGGGGRAVRCRCKAVEALPCDALLPLLLPALRRDTWLSDGRTLSCKDLPGSGRAAAGERLQSIPRAAQSPWPMLHSAGRQLDRHFACHSQERSRFNSRGYVAASGCVAGRTASRG